ncbi:Leucine rich repeat [Carpediemonas membranifera]|uniref:Leucine rich repeat n=1 Tax=Carpediemonas membranifera TaxID=201153 RepID=A0A8J6DYZ2_9EUKA|nr:Leucine rich repeat [Carpediemonas membranifera]|eukprot:KAG9392919.1 Leucine rich repeat [Carpediemonas membranifera]
MKITKKWLKKLCQEQQLYSTPSCNEVLYLHFKGIEKIENLEEYVNLATLWLEGNAITTIENLDHLEKSLRCLYLQENGIETISGLTSLKALAQVNLSDNQIKSIDQDSFAGLDQLTSVQLCRNRLQDISGLAGLVAIPNLSTLDLTGNNIADVRVLEQVFMKMPSLKVLMLVGNEVIKSMSTIGVPYRFTMVAALETLTYLDDKPVFDDERRAVPAWKAAGGLRLYLERGTLSDDEKRQIKMAAGEAMRVEREAIRVEKEAAHRKNMDDFEQMIRQARIDKGLDPDDCPLFRKTAGAGEEEADEDMPGLEDEEGEDVETGEESAAAGVEGEGETDEPEDGEASPDPAEAVQGDSTFLTTAEDEASEVDVDEVD